MSTRLIVDSIPRLYEIVKLSGYADVGYCATMPPIVSNLQVTGGVDRERL